MIVTEPTDTDDPTEAIIDGIIEREGRTFTNYANDRGGPTKFGITLETLRDFRDDRGLTAGDVEALDEGTAHDIYRHAYVIGPGFDGIEDEQLRIHVIDAGVHHGPGWAARRLQEVAEASLKIDGVVGPLTLSAVNAADPDRLHLLFIARRMLKYMRIVAADAKARGCFEGQITFLEGWGKRLAWFIEDEARR